MTIEQVRKAHKRQPFEPFLLHLADGRSIAVPHPEFLYIPPKADRCVFVSDDHGVVETIDLLLVVSLKPERNGSRPRRR